MVTTEKITVMFQAVDAPVGTSCTKCCLYKNNLLCPVAKCRPEQRPDKRNVIFMK